MSWEFKSPHPHFFMILLSIDNASEIIAQKLGKFIESLTPDSFDEAKEEDVADIVGVAEHRPDGRELLKCSSGL